MEVMSANLPDATRDFTRRRLLGLLAAVLASGSRALGAALGEAGLEIDRLWPEAIFPERAPTDLRYRVDATVLLLSFPIFRRAGVGDARVAVREIAEKAGRLVAIEFAAQSDPARAHGLDRRGWIREAVVERSGQPVLAATLGLMTDSPEQSVEEAKTAFRESGRAPRLVAIDGRSASGSTGSRVLHFEPPAGEPIASVHSLDEVRRRFAADPPAWRRTEWSHQSGAPMTFLYALLRALERPGPATESYYVFNENQYRLHTECAPDAERGREFAMAGLTASAEHIVRVRGRIENLTKRTHPVPLQLWIDTAGPAPCPVRVEFNARSFLRLTLERLAPASDHSPKEQI